MTTMKINRDKQISFQDDDEDKHRSTGKLSWLVFPYEKYLGARGILVIRPFDHIKST